jgi:hypothetical protein
MGDMLFHNELSRVAALGPRFQPQWGTANAPVFLPILNLTDELQLVYNRGNLIRQFPSNETILLVMDTVSVTFVTMFMIAGNQLQKEKEKNDRKEEKWNDGERSRSSDLQLCGIRSEATFRRNLSPPSSGPNTKSSKKPHGKFLLVCRLANSSTLKKEAICSFETQ